MNKPPTSLEEFRKKRTPRTTVTVAMDEDSVLLEVGGKGAKLDPSDAMRLSNYLRKKACELLRRKLQKRRGDS